MLWVPLSREAAVPFVKVARGLGCLSQNLSPSQVWGQLGWNWGRVLVGWGGESPEPPPEELSCICAELCGPRVGVRGAPWWEDP